MFLRAGFNPRNYDTGIRAWTRHVRGNRRGFSPAELRLHANGDYFWHGKGFAVWGDVIVLGSHWIFDLRWEWQHGLPQSTLK